MKNIAKFSIIWENVKASFNLVKNFFKVSTTFFRFIKFKQKIPVFT